MVFDLTPILDRIKELEQRVAQLESEAKAPPVPVNEWMTIKEAAQVLRVSVSTVHRMCKGGELRKYRSPSGQPRLRAAEVQQVYQRKVK